MKFIIHSDGGARGNPGPSAIGVLIEEVTNVNPETKKIVSQFGKRIGESTNNIAEYAAVISALNFLKDYLSHHSLDRPSEKLTVDFFLDSLLVVNQLNGQFKIKQSHLRELFLQVQQLIVDIAGSVTFTYVPRSQNSRADSWVNQALDGAI